MFFIHKFIKGNKDLSCVDLLEPCSIQPSNYTEKSRKPQFIFKTLIEKLLREIKKAIHTHGEKDCKKKKKRILHFLWNSFFEIVAEKGNVIVSRCLGKNSKVLHPLLGKEKKRKK